MRAAKYVLTSFAAFFCDHLFSFFGFSIGSAFSASVYLAFYASFPTYLLQVFIACRQKKIIALRCYLLLGPSLGPFPAQRLEQHLQRQAFLALQSINNVILPFRYTPKLCTSHLISSSLSGIQCLCPVASSTWSGVAENGLRRRMAYGGEWLAAERDLIDGSRGERHHESAQNEVCSRSGLFALFLLFLFPFHSYPVATWLAYRLLQVFYIFPPIRFIFPVEQTEESFSVR